MAKERAAATGSGRLLLILLNTLAGSMNALDRILSGATPAAALEAPPAVNLILEQGDRREQLRQQAVRCSQETVT